MSFSLWKLVAVAVAFSQESFQNPSSFLWACSHAIIASCTASKACRAMAAWLSLPRLLDVIKDFWILRCLYVCMYVLLQCSFADIIYSRRCTYLCMYTSTERESCKYGTCVVCMYICVHACMYVCVHVMYRWSDISSPSMISRSLDAFNMASVSTTVTFSSWIWKATYKF